MIQAQTADKAVNFLVPALKREPIVKYDDQEKRISPLVKLSILLHFFLLANYIATCMSGSRIRLLGSCRKP